MTDNKWLGVAQARSERRYFIPRNASPGSVWLLKVGSRTYSYEYPDSIEAGTLTQKEIGLTVAQGIADAFSNSSAAFGGGTDGTALTLSATLYNGEWAVVAIGASDGTPLDVSLVVQNPSSAYVVVQELQKGRPARNEIQRIRWPKAPSGGTVQFGNRVPYHVTANAVVPGAGQEFNFKFTDDQNVDTFGTAVSSANADPALRRLQIITSLGPVASGAGLGNLTVTHAGGNNFTIEFDTVTIGSLYYINVTSSTTTLVVTITPSNVNGPLAYNASAATVEAALEAVYGSGGVDVRGAYNTGYQVEFINQNAGKSFEPISVYSTDAVGVGTYKVEILEHAGLVRSTYVMDRLNGNRANAYRFVLQGQSGHYFTGADGVAVIQSALESVPTIGVGNVTTVAQADGSTLIRLTGQLVGIDVGLLALESADDAIPPGLTAGPTDDDTHKYRQRITFLNMPYAPTSQYKLLVAGVSTDYISYISSSSAINTALLTAGITGFTVISQEGGQDRPLIIELEYDSILVDGPLVLVDPAGLRGTIGFDVSKDQTAQTALNEVQHVSIATDPTGGTFKLTFIGQQTGSLDWDASAAEIETALRALSSVGSPNVKVNGPDKGPWIVEFQSALGFADQPLIVGDGSTLTLPNAGLVHIVQDRLPTGPNWYTNVANWSLNHLPAGSERAVFENCSVPCKYGIDGVPAFAGLDIYRSYTGDGIGLLPIREDGTPETLPVALRLTDNSASFVLRIGLGEVGDGPTLVRIDTDDQATVASVLHSGTAGGDGSLPVMLAGTLTELTISAASVGIATVSGETADVQAVRMRAGTQEGSSLEWGEGAVIHNVEMQGGDVRAGSVPKSFFGSGGTLVVRGDGDLDALTARDTAIRWLAGGKLGKQANITGIALDGLNQLLITSVGHGLSEGARVFVRGLDKFIRGVPDAYYGIDIQDADHFALVGTAPLRPFGAATPTGVSAFYESGKAQWGVADAIVLGGEAVFDLSEIAVIRQCVAPVVLQSADARFIDPIVTIPNLRERYDPGALEDTLGIRCVILRDERSSASASEGGAGGGGGLVGAQPGF